MKPENYKNSFCIVVLNNLLTFFIFFVFITSAYAGNFTVSTAAQFQTALNNCESNGQNDTINVLAGTYNVNPALTFSTNENYFLLIRCTGSPVFEGGNARRILQLISNSGDGDIFLEGMTFQHGRADYGGGLYISTQSADINISSCTFNDNTANFVAGGVNLFSNTGNIYVSNCTFRRNASPNTSGYPYGTAGGLFVQTDGAGTNIIMTGCIFEQNTAQRDAAGAMLYPLGINSTVIAESNSFISNTAKEAGGGCWIRGPGGNTTVKFRNNTLTGNSSSTAGNGGGTYIQIASGIIDLFDNVHTGNNASWQGGGLWIEHSGGTLHMFRNRFTNNTSGESGGGANIFLDYGMLKLDHNIFHKNRSTGAGGGLNLSTSTGNINIYNNTFYFNTSPEGGDVNLYFDNVSSSSNFLNNILYNSTQPALTVSGQETVIAKYSDIQGGIGQTWFGTGCLDTYPFFADTAGGNFHLQDSIHCGSQRYSRCIDAGEPAYQDSTIICTWGLGAIRSDMGAYGGKHSIPIGIIKLNEKIPAKFNLSQNYPNPFNPVTKIRFTIPGINSSLKRGMGGVIVKLTVFDILGKEAAVLVSEQLSSGFYEVEWNATGFSGGVYFYKLQCIDYIDVKKMVLIK